MTSSVVEHPLQWLCEGDGLVGVLARPTGAAGRLGAVIVVGGPQVRAGSHRQFVLTARALAGAGVPTLRFDVRGMGDSEGEARSFEKLEADIGSAIDALLTAEPALDGVLLVGLCDAASAVLLYLDARRDPRVKALCLLNPWVRSAQSQAQARVKHYYRQRLFDAGFWRKLLRGGVALNALRGLLQSWRASRNRPAEGADSASFQQRMERGWHWFTGASLLVLSEDDLTAQEFLEYSGQRPDWMALLARPHVRRLSVPGGDHTLSRSTDLALVLRELCAWLGPLQGAQRVQALFAQRPAHPNSQENNAS